MGCVRMKQAFLAGVCAVVMILGATSAQAQDGEDALPTDWSGFIAGGHVGFGFGDANWQETAEPLPVAWDDTIAGANQRPKDNPEGFIGGAHVGYNFQIGQFVFGPEVSISGADIDDRSVATFGGFDDQYKFDIDFVFTATARLGFAMDQFMIYAKGGYAGANVNLSIFDPTPVAQNWGRDGWQSGFTVGGGFEYMFSPVATLGIEYNYVDLGRRSYSNADSTGGALTFRADVEVHTVLARVSFKLSNLFGGI